MFKLEYQYQRTTKDGRVYEGGYSSLKRWFCKTFLGDTFVKLTPPKAQSWAADISVKRNED